MKDIENRLIEIERAIADHDRIVNDLNNIVFEQGKLIDALIKQNKYLMLQLENDLVKPLSQEVPPPHY